MDRVVGRKLRLSGQLVNRRFDSNQSGKVWRPNNAGALLAHAEAAFRKLLFRQSHHRPDDIEAAKKGLFLLKASNKIPIEADKKASSCAGRTAGQESSIMNRTPATRCGRTFSGRVQANVRSKHLALFVAASGCDSRRM